MTILRFITVLIAFGLVGSSAVADTRRVVERSDFVALVEGQTLTRLGIRLNVTASGAIQGRAFGQPVQGQWQWQDGFFCRDLFWGEQDLGPNCQQVTVNGDVIRFTSDRGTGQYADLTLK